MAIVIDQMDVQPAAPSPPKASGNAAGNEPVPASEREKAIQIEKILRSDHERLLRVRAY